MTDELMDFPRAPENSAFESGSEVINTNAEPKPELDTSHIFKPTVPVRRYTVTEFMNHAADKKQLIYLLGTKGKFK